MTFYDRFPWVYFECCIGIVQSLMDDYLSPYNNPPARKEHSKMIILANARGAFRFIGLERWEGAN